MGTSWRSERLRREKQRTGFGHTCVSVSRRGTKKGQRANKIATRRQVRMYRLNEGEKEREESLHTSFPRGKAIDKAMAIRSVARHSFAGSKEKAESRAREQSTKRSTRECTAKQEGKARRTVREVQLYYTIP